MKPFQKLIFVAGLLEFWLPAFSSYGGITFTTLLSFNGANGANPVANLVQGPNGNLYGTAPNGGASNAGAIFEISPDGSFFTNCYTFPGGTNGASPAGALVLGSDGNFYGTTFNGGVSNWGTIFRLSPNGSLTQLGVFHGTNGANPNVALTEAADGSFYGTTEYGGPSTNTTSGGTGYGVIFRITTNGDLSFPVLLAGTNGANATSLVRGKDGNFYGTTAWGGNVNGQVPLGFGTVFRLNLDGTFTNLYKFSGGGDGGFIYAGLIQASDGDFYGAAFNGGAYGGGDVFRISPDGVFTNLYSFGVGGAGTYPYSALVQGSDGNFYGTTLGYFSNGTVFEITPAGAVAPLVSFTGTSGSFLGANPQGSLIQGNDGNFYGTTYRGGTYNDGTVFRLSLPLPPVFQSITRTNGTVKLVWSSVATQSYQLQYKTNLAQTNWTDLGGQVVATKGTMTASDSAGSASQRFYQVVLE